MNIVMLGYRGTGKSTIAKIIAKRLHRRLFIIDAMIAKSAGVSIPKIVEQWGWLKFREIESAQVREVAERFNNVIIDCGGGVVLNSDNIERLRLHGRTVLLTADFETILKRIRKDPNRPPLKEGLTFEEEQKQVLNEREPLYRSAADIICDTSAASQQETASTIIRAFREKRWI